MNRKDEDWELEELDLDEELGERQHRREEPDDWEERGNLKPGVMVLIFLGLMVLAAIICGILWNVTHRDRGNEETVEYTSEVQEETTGTAGQDVTEPSSEGTGLEPGDEGQSETEPSSGGANSETETEEQGVASPSDEGTGAGSQPEGQGAAAPSDEGTGQVSQPEEQEASVPSSEGTTAVSKPSSEAVPDTTASSAGTTEDSNRVSTKDGRVIVFTDCDDTVSPKEYVNLRLEPSTSEGNSTIHCRLNYGETVHRTGISEDSGWSRVEKDGVVCYVVTSLIYVVE